MSDNPGEIVAGSKELSKKLLNLLSMVGPRQRQVALMTGGLVLEAWMKRNAQAQHLILTGNLRASITAEPDGELAVTIGPRNVKYAAIHEFGGTITPKNAKYLAIPVTQTARQAGSPRRFGGKLHAQMVAGGGALVDEDGNIQYALKRSVKIPARPYVRPAMDEHGNDAAKAVGVYLKRKIDQIAEVTVATIDDALYSLLINHSSIIAAVSDRVYPDLLPHDCFFPAITFQEVSLTPSYNQEGDSNLDQSRFQFDCFATTRTGARVVADALRVALSGIKTSEQGVRIHSSFLVNSLSGHDDALNQWRLIQDYQITYSASR